MPVIWQAFALFLGHESSDTWFGEQAEGGEQGAPLMPMLIALGIHDALARAKFEPRAGEHLSAFLDNVCAVCQPFRVRDVYEVLRRHLGEVAGIRLHEGKTRGWNRAGVCPPRLEDLDPDVWSPSGVKVLGTPLGTKEFAARLLDERVEEEQTSGRGAATA